MLFIAHTARQGQRGHPEAAIYSLSLLSGPLWFLALLISLALSSRGFFHDSGDESFFIKVFYMTYSAPFYMNTTF